MVDDLWTKCLQTEWSRPFPTGGSIVVEIMVNCEGAEMRIFLLKRPSILLESVEVLYAYVNEIPARDLAGEGSYCIPVHSMQKMMDTVCAGMSRHDPTLRFFFEKTELQNEAGQCTCIARNMVYSSVTFSCTTVEESITLLQKKWQRFMQAEEYPASIEQYAVECGGRGEVASLAQGLEGLPITEGYRIRLQEALEHFDVYIQQLAELLEPVAQYLTPFLDLWAAKSEPLFQEWEAYFAQQDLKKWLKNRCQLYVNNGCEVLQIVPRYIGAGTAHYEMDEAEHVVSLQIGVGFAIRKAPKTGLEDWELLALRLLAGPARIKMIAALRERPMSTREMARELGLHLGSVGRDVSSLMDARLLLVELNEGRSRYRVNPAALDILANHLLALKPDID